MSLPIKYNGKTIAQLSAETGINRATICYRLRNGLSIEEAISVKPNAGGSNLKLKYDIIGKTFTDRFGNEFDVLCLDHRDKNSVAYYKVRFKQSGYETTAPSSMIRSVGHAHVFDRLSPSIHGVGIIGYAYEKDNPKLFQVWRSMIARCYNKKNPSYKTYGNVGIVVCERWKRFDYFLEDAVNIPGYDYNKLLNGEIVLDKDCIDRSKKIYSPETCTFISRPENTKESSYRRWHKSEV